MATSNSKRNGSVAAVVYLRKSTKGKDGRERQEASISEQRKAVKQLAESNGYRILREYIDHESGDKTDKREAFQRLRDDACNGRDFDVILCWDIDRFGRFDSIEAGHWIYPLRSAGVRLETVRDGAVDWNDFSGRLMYQIKQEGKHQQLHDLSCNTQRGRLAMAQRGEWPGQPPIGYTVDKGDRLVLSHAEDVELVRRIFRDYQAGGSLNDLAAILNRQGIRTRSGGKWYRSAVREILKRRLYTGDFVWNGSSKGSYTSIRGGTVAPAGKQPVNSNPTTSGISM